MTLSEATAEVLKGYSHFDGDADETFVICSGGSMLGDKMPALYASEHLALTEFVSSARALLSNASAKDVKFLDGPHLDRYNMTVETPRRQHRIAEPRWAVQAKIGVKIKAKRKGG